MESIILRSHIMGVEITKVSVNEMVRKEIILFLKGNGQDV